MELALQCLYRDDVAPVRRRSRLHRYPRCSLHVGDDAKDFLSFSFGFLSVLRVLWLRIEAAPRHCANIEFVSNMGQRRDGGQNAFEDDTTTKIG